MVSNIFKDIIAGLLIIIYYSNMKSQVLIALIGASQATQLVSEEENTNAIQLKDADMEEGMDLAEDSSDDDLAEGSSDDDDLAEGSSDDDDLAEGSSDDDDLAEDSDDYELAEDDFDDGSLAQFENTQLAEAGTETDQKLFGIALAFLAKFAVKKLVVYGAKKLATYGAKKLGGFAMRRGK